MIGSLAAFAISVASTLAAWIEAAYIVACPLDEDDAGNESGRDLAWLPALSGVTVASAQAIQAHATRAYRHP